MKLLAWDHETFMGIKFEFLVSIRELKADIYSQ